MAKSSQQQPVPDFPIGEIILGLLRSVCLTVDVFLHRRIGVTYISSGFAGILVLLVVIAQFPSSEQLSLISFTKVYFGVWLIALISAYLREWRGRVPLHSGYTGEPFLWKLLPGWREEYVKQLESVLVIVLSAVSVPFSRALGLYLMSVGVLLFLRGCILMARQRYQVRMMNDLVIEQRITSDRINANS